MRLAHFVVALALAAPFAADAQYPARPVRVLVGYVAGSSTDIVGRVMADRLGAYWKQTVFVENRGGAAGNVAADAAAKAAGDGYTLLFAQNGLAISAAALPNLPYKAETDLVPLAPVAATPHILIVAPGLSGEERAGADRPRARRAGQARVRLVGRRQLRPSLRRAVQRDGRHPGAARPVQGRRAGGDRRDGRTHRVLLRRHAGRPAAREVGTGARARRDRQAALRRRAGHPDGRGAGPPGVRGAAVAGLLRARRRRRRSSRRASRATSRPCSRSPRPASGCRRPAPSCSRRTRRGSAASSPPTSRNGGTS